MFGRFGSNANGSCCTDVRNAHSCLGACRTWKTHKRKIWCAEHEWQKKGTEKIAPAKSNHSSRRASFFSVPHQLGLSLPPPPPAAPPSPLPFPWTMIMAKWFGMHLVADAVATSTIPTKQQLPLVKREHKEWVEVETPTPFISLHLSLCRYDCSLLLSDVYVYVDAFFFFFSLVCLSFAVVFSATVRSHSRDFHFAHAAHALQIALGKMYFRFFNERTMHANEDDDGSTVCNRMQCAHCPFNFSYDFSSAFGIYSDFYQPFELFTN